MKFTILLALFFIASASADTEYELKTILVAKQQKPVFFQWIPFPNRGVFGKLELTATSNGTDLGVIGGSELVELLNGRKTYKVTLPDDLSSVDSIGLKWSNVEKDKLSILFVTDLKVTGPADESEKFRSEHTALRPEVVYNFDRVIKPTEPATTEAVTTEAVATEASTTEESTTEPATTEASTTEASTTEATEAASTDAAKAESEASSEAEAVSTETVAEETSSSETVEEASSEGQSNVEEETSTEGQSDSSSAASEAQAETAASINEDGQSADNVSNETTSGENASQETTDAVAQEAQPKSESEPTSSESA